MKFFQKHLFQLHIAVLLFGGAGLFVKFIPQSPLFITFSRVFFASLTLGCMLLFQGKSLKLISFKTFTKLILPGFLLAFHWFCFFKSISLSSVAVGLLTYATFPVFVIFAEPFFFREKIHLRSLLPAIISLAGVLLIIPGFDIHNNITLGVIFGLLSGISFALLAIINRRLVQHFQAIEIAFWQNSGAFLCLLPFAAISFPVIYATDLILMAVLGILFTAIAHSMFISSMNSIKARTASIIATLEPVYGIILAMLFLKEIPSIRVCAGGLIIIFVAVYLTYQNYHKSD